VMISLSVNDKEQERNYQFLLLTLYLFHYKILTTNFV
jgi:hypothetical protein